MIPDAILYEDEIKEADLIDLRLTLMGRSVIYGKDDCWVWAGPMAGPYGKLCTSRWNDFAHRLSWVAFKGLIP